MSWTLTQLETFCAVADAGSMHAASVERGYTPGAVSQQMAALARTVGGELFIRDGRGVVLSDAGRGFLPYARRLLQEYGVALVPDAALARSLRTHWDLPLIGLTCALGLWVDKLIMWVAAPIGVTTVGGAFRTMPNYDTPMFWAQLASIPILAVFFVHVETNFFRLSRAFYGSLAHGVSRRDLARKQARRSGCARGGSRSHGADPGRGA